jgi:hypothetical protein
VEEHLRGQNGGEIRRGGGGGGGRGSLTISVLVEEAEGLLELGDLVVGELIRHGRRRGGGESTQGMKLGKRGGREEGGREAGSVLREESRPVEFSRSDLYNAPHTPLDAAVTFRQPSSPNCPSLPLMLKFFFLD